eukprot:TRINITY_DN366_c1_g1_i1.p1 TRINITY_DN366_c1_g1~~TRINITY_DN366_c1_g1_i1.p1  ORF type:complete len:785 (+),score=122.94 TRINITY_DN366_c1_g1_i1:314-2668(+)
MTKSSLTKREIIARARAREAERESEDEDLSSADPFGDGGSGSGSGSGSDSGGPESSDDSSSSSDNSFDTNSDSSGGVDMTASAESSSAEDEVQPQKESGKGKGKGKSASTKVPQPKRATSSNTTEGDATIGLSGKKDKEQVLLYDGGVARASDSSSHEAGEENTIGNVPLYWYEDHDHIGYNLKGEKIMKKSRKDELDNFLEKMDNPDYWRTVRDEMNDQEHVLSNEDLDLIYRIQKGQFAEGVDPYPEYQDWFQHEEGKIHPLSNRPEPKSRFVPSKWEHKKIMKIVRAIRKGWIKEKKEVKPDVYEIWDDANTEPTDQGIMHIPAPKMALPGHAESYNPPVEYVPTEEEANAWALLDPEDRPYNFVPAKYSSLKSVPAYPDFIKERFERCLDLYLCPRTRKTRLNIDPESLIPKLPKPKELRPFPTTQAHEFVGHTALVRSVSVCPNGQFLVTASDDKTVRLWDVMTTRLMQTWTFEDVPTQALWSPNANHHLVAVASGNRVFLIIPKTATKAQAEATSTLLYDGAHVPAVMDPSGKNTPPGQWAAVTDAGTQAGIRVQIQLAHRVTRVSWHHKGDYIATLAPAANTTAIAIHQISRRSSQHPFRKAKGKVQCMAFHPTKPFFIVASQRYVRIYNLVKQELTKKLLPSVQWISSLAVHPGGDNLIIGSYDKTLAWFDLDLSDRPYKTLRYHQYAIRSCVYHPRLPLFASSSDDANIHVFHGKVYNDLLQNPLIVPVKILRGHSQEDFLGVMDVVFHPTQPWLFSAGSDKTVRMFTDVHSGRS